MMMNSIIIFAVRIKPVAMADIGVKELLLQNLPMHMCLTPMASPAHFLWAII